MTKNTIDKYNPYEINLSHDMENFAKELEKKAKENNIPIEKDIKTLKNEIDSDLRDNVPPQIYSVVSGIIDLLNKLEEVEKNEG